MIMFVYIVIEYVCLVGSTLTKIDCTKKILKTSVAWTPLIEGVSQSDIYRV